MSKFYVRDWGRPCGVEPVIYTDKAKADVDAESQFGPSIVEFNTEFEARKFIRDCAPDEQVKVK